MTGIPVAERVSVSRGHARKPPGFRHFSELLFSTPANTARRTAGFY